MEWIRKYNPIKGYRRWRASREERKNARLRLLSLTLATKSAGGLMIDVLTKTHVYYLYLKYGFDKSGVEVGEIFKRVGEEVPGFKVPDRPLKP